MHPYEPLSTLSDYLSFRNWHTMGMSTKDRARAEAGLGQTTAGAGQA